MSEMEKKVGCIIRAMETLGLYDRDKRMAIEAVGGNEENLPGGSYKSFTKSIKERMNRYPYKIWPSLYLVGMKSKDDRDSTKPLSKRLMAAVPDMVCLPRGIVYDIILNSEIDKLGKQRDGQSSEQPVYYGPTRALLQRGVWVFENIKE